MKVGFMGIQPDNANLGLAALAYSSVSLVGQLIPNLSEIVMFSSNSEREIERMRRTLGLGSVAFTTRPLRLRDPMGLVKAMPEMASCDLIIDFTGGDSFSDIYGVRRLARKLLNKQMVLWTRTPLVLGPQTYGPLAHRVIAPWFKHVVGRASQVYTRDKLSADFLASLVSREVRVATDVAVALPWDDRLYTVTNAGNRRVGISVSGLLWMGGYTRQNQFGLRSDYREYCHRLVDWLLNSGWDVHLVAHVVGRAGEEIDEDDMRACLELAEAHPRAILAPTFGSPVEAKSFIGQMDLFIGSRMHATIASFTSGVPTIPVAYSRKFAGFFGNLDYEYVVDLTAMDTLGAIGRTVDHVGNLEGLADAVERGVELAKARIGAFTAGLDTLVQGLTAATPVRGGRP